MATNAITTQASGQKELITLTGTKWDQGAYRAVIGEPERTDMGAFLLGFNKNDVTEIMGFTDHPRRAKRRVTDYYLTPFTAESNPHLMLGVRVRAPEVTNTLTPDIFISHASSETNFVYWVSRAILGMTSGSYTFEGTSQSHQLPDVDERSRHISKMEETLRHISELPDNWDSYEGSTISPAAVDEARQILMSAIDLNLPNPWVAPGGDAGVGIQWDTDQAELYIDIVPGEETTYVLTPKVGHLHEADGVLTTANLPRILIQLAKPTI